MRVRTTPTSATPMKNRSVLALKKLISPSTMCRLIRRKKQCTPGCANGAARKSKQKGVPVYVVAHNSMLQQIAQRGINSRDELLQIERFGQKRVDKYGDAILAVLASDQDDE